MERGIKQIRTNEASPNAEKEIKRTITQTETNQNSVEAGQAQVNQYIFPSWMKGRE